MLKLSCTCKKHLETVYTWLFIELLSSRFSMVL